MLDISDCAYEDFVCELGHQEWFEYATMVEHQPNLQCMGSTNTYPKEKQSDNNQCNVEIVLDIPNDSIFVI